MLFVINVYWTRRTPQDGRPNKGHTTYAEYARSLNGAKRKGSTKFRKHYGMHLAVDRTEEFNDPAGIFSR